MSYPFVLELSANSRGNEQFLPISAVFPSGVRDIVQIVPLEEEHASKQFNIHLEINSPIRALHP